MDNLLQQVAAITGPGGVLTGADVSARAGDWLGLSTCQARAIVRPASTHQLSQIMDCAMPLGKPWFRPAG